MGLFSLLLGIFMVVLDGTLMNVSLVQVSASLSITLEDMQTLITFYSLVTGAFLLLGGKLADIYGRRRIFRIGAILFGLGSLLSAIAFNGVVLFIGWSLLEGIGAALMMPASTSIIVNTFKGRKRALAFGLWGATASVGAAFGPIIGGAITTYASWRYAFLLQVVLAVFVVMTARQLKESKPLAGKRIDWIGAFLSVIGISLLIWGVLKVRAYGWFYKKKVLSMLGVDLGIFGLSPAFWGLVLGALLIAIFAIYQLKVNNPLLNIRIFRYSEFTIGLVVTALVNLAMAGLMFVFPIYFQVLKNYSALLTGLKLLPITVGVFLASVLGARWRMKDKLIILTGVGIALLGAVLLYTVGLSASSEADWGLLLPFFLFGFGLGLIMAKLTNIVMTGVPARFAGEASGVNSTVRRLASSLGTAVTGTLFFSSFEDSEFYKKMLVYFGTPQMRSPDIRVISVFLKRLPPKVYEIIYFRFAEAVVSSVKYVLSVPIIIFLLLLVGVVLWYRKEVLEKAKKVI